MTDHPPALAGIDVHGIQRYVFRGSRLREITGGSHLVDEATAEWPYAAAKALGLTRHETDGSLSPDTWQPLRTAGGKVRARFHDVSTARRWCEMVTESMTDRAPGLHFASAIVSEDGDPATTYHRLHQRLEEKRDRTGQDGRFMGFPFTAPCRTTGDAASGYGAKRNERLSEEMLSKQKSARDASGALLEDLRSRLESQTVLADALDGIGVDSPLRWPLDLSELVPEDANGGYMGVACFDGNAIGARIQAIFESNPQQAVPQFAAFSEGIARCTRQALVDAIEAILFLLHRDEGLPRCHGRLPIRVLLEGGDDVVAVVRPDLALPFARHLVDAFERATTADPAVGPLTAAVGVAVTKAKAPILGAVELAGELLEEAKNKGRDTGRISFYLASSALPADLHRERQDHWRSDDGHSLTGWPRTISETDAFLDRATFATQELPRNQVRGAMEACRRSVAAADAEFDRLRDVVLRDFSETGTGSDLLATLDRLWPSGWFAADGEHQTTDLRDCLDLSRFLAPAKETIQ